MNDRRSPTLDERLARLPLEIEPPVDRWPAVAGRLRRMPAFGRWVALAAGLACAGIGTAMIWAMLHARPTARAAAVAMREAAVPTVAPAAEALRAPDFDEPRDPALWAARTELERSFQERLRLLDPGTRANIEASLQVIRRAHEDIRAALAGAPADPVLEALLTSTWHDEFDLYDRVVQATQLTQTQARI